MPDEIINYVQSLQKQVELLSMNLATVNPELDFNMDSVFAKEMLQSPIPSLGCSSETANPTYFQLNSMEELVSYCGLDMPALRVLILTPRRELAVQIHSMIGKLAQFITDIRYCLVLRGLSTKAQEAALRSLPDIVVATPGRMIDHLLNSMRLVSFKAAEHHGNLTQTRLDALNFSEAAELHGNLAQA
ncbi:hypothetical protein L2E82_13218 [Cichorium intybus]|uniref:Uncharacterized protein n=1 Tax=Cichorium intybus TaxID=13427 RepID=A0ACB9GI93_CICIN|nr:hypothetical protein L2E82_13218 [Cichorium intybus]